MICNSRRTIFYIYNTTFCKTVLFHQLLHNPIIGMGIHSDIPGNIFTVIRNTLKQSMHLSIPGKPVELGHRHPMYIALDEIKDIFIGMGFTVLDGPEVELAEYNFDRLNAEEGHPSRDWSDTFYFDEDSRVMLRSQTSPMQVRAMETMELPIRIIAPGRVYRKDEVDATHSPMFHQVEGMVIDKGVTMADLKGTLNTVVEQLYGKGTKTRFRPHHFPFTEPSCEMDVQCHKCGGVGCPTCKGEGWIELLGAGMIHPKVLKMSGIDPEVYSGWAFGIGLERTAMRRFCRDKNNASSWPLIGIICLR